MPTTDRRRHSAAGVGRRLRARIEEIVGRRVVSTRCGASAGTSLAERWLVLLDTGETVFVKVGDDAASRWEVRNEVVVLREVDDSLFPALLGFDDHPIKPLMVVEDLTDSFWPPPWRPGDPELVEDALERIAATPPPQGLRTVIERPDLVGGWARVAEDPAPLVGTGLVSEAWLERCLEPLARAAAGAPVAGDRLVHLDVRGGNVCFVGSRVVVVDWANAAIGHPGLDRAFWRIGLAAEGGPGPPDDVDPGLVAVATGWFAAEAGLPPRRWGGGPIRASQRERLAVALRWACRLLGVEEPPSG
ncbi:MAG: aminoglycoside phosphotransferase family protein [Acidimicrobiia bacterium]|nr:aminoglycoside phosphotransferase family protein [Acidimicrobiia bacterium]